VAENATNISRPRKRKALASYITFFCKNALHDLCKKMAVKHWLLTLHFFAKNALHDLCKKWLKNIGYLHYIFCQNTLHDL
jgi:hypothetical protein